MKLARPQTAAHFAQQVRALVDGGWHRAAVAYAQQYGPEFLPLLSDDERSRITATMEGVGKILDQQDREARQGTVEGIAPAVGGPPYDPGQNLPRRLVIGTRSL